MKVQTSKRVLALLFGMLLSLTTAFAQEKDAEEERLHNIVFKYFDSMDDDAFYDAIATYRNYVKSKDYESKYWNSWSNEIIYDINHDHYYWALKKTEDLQAEIKEAEAKDYSFIIDYLMGVFYGTRDDNQLCIEYLKRALDQTDPKKNSSDQVAIYQMLANICIFEEGDQGIEWADRAIAISADNYQLCGSVGVKAMVVFTHNDRQAFDECYSRIEKIREETPDDYYPIYQVYIDMGRYAFNGEYDKAIATADSLQSESEKYAFMAAIYNRKGDIKAENEVLRKLISAKERRNSEISTLTINDISNDIEINKERQQRRRAELYTIIAIFASLVVTIGLLAYFVWTRRKHLALLNIVITGDKIYESRFSASALAYEGYSLSLGDGKVDILQYPLVCILKAHITELYLMVEVVKTLGDSRILNGILCLKDLVDTLHRCKSLRYVVAGT